MYDIHICIYYILCMYTLRREAPIGYWFEYFDRLFAISTKIYCPDIIVRMYDIHIYIILCMYDIHIQYILLYVCTCSIKISVRTVHTVHTVWYNFTENYPLKLFFYFATLSLYSSRLSKALKATSAVSLFTLYGAFTLFMSCTISSLAIAMPRRIPFHNRERVLINNNRREIY